MSLIERPEFKKRRPVPAGIKLLLLLAVIAGLLIRSCWYRSKIEYLGFEDIVVTDTTLSSTDVLFTVINHTRMEINESILLVIYSNQNEKIGSRITQISVGPRRKVRFRKVVSNWERGLRPGEFIKFATVEIYTPSIFN